MIDRGRRLHAIVVALLAIAIAVPGTLAATPEPGSPTVSAQADLPAWHHVGLASLGGAIEGVIDREPDGPDPSATIRPQPTSTPRPTPSRTPKPEATRTAKPSATRTPKPSATRTPKPSRTPRPTRTAKPRATRDPGTIRTRSGVAYMDRQACGEHAKGCINRANILYPSKRGPWPVIVTIHGRPRTQRDMAEVAMALARKGAVVYNVDYRGVRPAYTKGFPGAIEDVACAIRYARATATRYGGDPDHVVLVGHSMGGYVGMMVALAGDTFGGNRAACHANLPMKASLPDGFVHVAGVSTIHKGYRIDQVFVGGTYAEIPKVWRRATIYTHMGGNPGLEVGIIFERRDPFLGVGHATNLHRALRRHGYRARLELLDAGTTHFDILDTDLAIGRRVVDLVWRIVRRTTPD